MSDEVLIRRQCAFAIRFFEIVLFCAFVIYSLMLFRETSLSHESKQTGSPSVELQVSVTENILARIFQTDYLDGNGKLAIASDLHYARTIKYYDEWKQLIAEEFYNDNGELILVPKGYAIIKYEYDNEGRKVSERYFGEDRSPCNISAGYAMKSVSYGEDNKIAVERFFSSELLPVQSSDGCFGLKRVYNDQQQNIMVEFLDSDGLPANCRRGYAIESRTFDSLGRLAEVRYYDKDNHPTAIETGEYGIRYQYEDGIRIMSYLDAQGQCMNSSIMVPLSRPLFENLS